MRVRNKAELIPCRPRVFEVPGNLYGFIQLMRECWDEEPTRRPTAARTRSRLRELSGGKYTNNYFIIYFGGVYFKIIISNCYSNTKLLNYTGKIEYCINKRTLYKNLTKL